MTGALEMRLKAVDHGTLVPVAVRALGAERADVIEWRCQPVRGGLGGAYGVYPMPSAGAGMAAALSACKRFAPRDLDARLPCEQPPSGDVILPEQSKDIHRQD